MEKMFYLGIALLFLTTTFANPVYEILAGNEEPVNYRLPSHIQPTDYVLDIVVSQDILDNKVQKFNGKVTIMFTSKADSKNITLHSPKTINSIIVDNKSVDISKDTHVDKITSILTITHVLDEKIKSHNLTITYTANINETIMYGFYRSSYKNKDKKTEYLLATQFEPVSAREAFPCLDEPMFKATFTLSLTCPNQYKVLFNTDQDKSEKNGKNTKVTFKKTKPMSTYLVAFMVSKFSSTDEIVTKDSIPTKVWSRNDLVNYRKLAAEYGPKILNALEDFTSVPFKNVMSKMDQVAVPDFGAGAMENWGLVTYRERLLLYDEKESSESDKQTILSVIAHEFSHQWFGDLVTCEWWNDIFLNEGFAAYFQFFLLNQTGLDLEKSEFDKQFIVAEQQPVLVDDALDYTKSLLSDANSTDEIHAKFDTITYNKGASLIRMMENIMGSEQFKKGLNEYLNKNALRSATHLTLLHYFNVPLKHTPENFSYIMEKWFENEGYPVVTVTQNDNDLILKQERFSYNRTGKKSQTWTIPISYTRKSKPDFNTVEPKTWLGATKETFSDVFKDDKTSWIVVNIKESAYYRVQYSEDLWNRLVDQLESNHTIIDVLNRAQIVDDLFNLARARFDNMEYSKVFRYVNYLKNETDYYPWVSLLNSVNYVLTRVNEDSNLGKTIKTRIIELMDSVYKEISFNETDEEAISELKRDLIFDAACRYGLEDCVKNATDLFTKYVNGTLVDKNLKKVVYCNGLRYSKNEDKDWESLWKNYTKTDLPTEQAVLLGALGCTKNVSLLEKYLNLSIDANSEIRFQDISAVWSSVYTSSPVGAQKALDFMVNRHKEILSYYSDAPSLLIGLASQLNSDDQIKQLEDFLNNNDTNVKYKSVIKVALQRAQSNLDWMKSVKSDLEGYFLKNSGSAQIVGGMTSCVLVLIATVVKFLLV